uniref:Ubiquinone biosynthesis protein coq-8 n=1 Tax=Solanum tuberosum TaxID=4113 RepID=M1C8P2_SOLTU
MLKLARGMFDTKLPPGVKMLQPFSEESSVKKIAVEVHGTSSLNLWYFTNSQC